MKTTKSNPSPNHCLALNSKDNTFALVSTDAAAAIMSMGSTEGFNGINHSLKTLDKVVIRQDGPKCRVDIHKGASIFSSLPSGRVEAKKLAAHLASLYSAPLFNVKEDGKEVPICPSPASSVPAPAEEVACVPAHFLVSLGGNQFVGHVQTGGDFKGADHITIREGAARRFSREDGEKTVARMVKAFPSAKLVPSTEELSNEDHALIEKGWQKIKESVPAASHAEHESVCHDCGVSHKDQITLFPVNSTVIALRDIVIPGWEGIKVQEGTLGHISGHCYDGRAFVLFNVGSSHTFHNPEGFIALSPSPAEPVKVLGGEVKTDMFALLLSLVIDLQGGERVRRELLDWVLGDVEAVYASHAVRLAKIQRLETALREIETICNESAGDCRKRMGTRVGNILVAARAALA